MPLPKINFPFITLLAWGIAILISLSLVVRPDMLITWLLGVFLIIVSVLMSWLLFSRMLTPITFFLVPWGIVLLMYGLLLSDYYLAPLGYKTHFAIGLSSIAFLIGCTILKAVTPMPSTLSSSESFNRFSRPAWNINHLKWIIWALFALGFAATAYQVWMAGGLSEVLRNPAAIRFSFWRPESGYFYGLLVNAIVLAGYVVLTTGSSARIFTFLSVLAIFCLSISVSRTNTLLAVGQVAILYVVYARHRSLRLIVSLTAFFIVLFFGIFELRDVGQATLVERGLINLDNSLAFLSEPYLYLTTAVQNLQVNLEGASNFSLGARTLYPIIAWIQLDTAIDFSSQVYRPRYIVGTYLVDYYLDFSWVGIVVAPLIIGLASSWSYLKADRYAGNSTYVLLSALLLYSLSLSVFSNYFNNSEVWISIALIFILERLCGRSSDDTINDTTTKIIQ